MVRARSRERRVAGCHPALTRPGSLSRDRARTCAHAAGLFCYNSPSRRESPLPPTAKVARMKAVLKAAPAPGLEMRSVPDPTPAEGDVVLQVRSTSLCGTDVHIYRWDPWAQGRIHPPRILGHEMFG